MEKIKKGNCLNKKMGDDNQQEVINKLKILK